MELFDIPETAIGVFEQLHRLRVTVHDLRGSLWPHLRADRFHHAQAICQAVKMQGGDAKCTEFDVVHVRRQLPVLLEGRVHVCHAGLVEWVVPVFEKTALAWVIFAGARRPGETLRHLRPPGMQIFNAPAIKRLEPVELDEANSVLEHLRQLAARLESWSARAAMPATWSKDVLGANDLVARRRVIIQRFVHGNHVSNPSLEQLSILLETSASRASHIVRETCGSSFRELLVEARLNTAMGLLRATDLSVLDVSVRSGFPEVAHFHRMFRDRVGVTPRKYRLKNQT